MRRIIKPKYVDPVEFGGGQSLSFRPPMLFRDVSARAFPLKANIARLAEFCDQYLNADIPDEIVHYTPALPYVYFMSLNYGGMSATTLDAQRLGWVAQHEAFFLVPLQRWRREHGKLKFQGWTSVTPFIFVDDPLSMATGREVYGWPKNECWLEADRPQWTTHPRAPTRLFTMSADVFGHVYAGEREPPRTLVTIDRDAVASFAEYPLNYKCPWSITSVIPNLYTTSLSLMEEAAEFLAHLRLRGFPDFRTSDSLAEMAREGLSLYANMLAGLSPIPMPQFLGKPLSGTAARAEHVEDLPRYFTSTTNLKQFRDPSDPDLACYSALVESAMGVDRLNQIGLLGDWDLLRGDKSGGYSLSITRYRAQPIIETLGIEVPNLHQEAREGDVVTLRPSFPFWMDVDLYYGAGDVICSRTKDLGGGEWIEETAATGAAGPQRQGFARGRQHRHGAHRNAYNTALGAATLPITGPMRFPDLTVQVYPLLADKAVLKRFVDWYWNRLFETGSGPPKLQLELAGSYVYMTVGIVGDAYGKMWSATENIGWWAEREVSFSIPVRWMSEGRLVGLATIEPLVFADKPRAVATDREVNGRNSFKARIESPPDVWTSPGGPDAPRKLTRVLTESFLNIGFGLPSTILPLIEIGDSAPLPMDDLAGWRGVADTWGAALADDLHAKSRALRGPIEATQALALEVLARGAPLNRLTLKQYRDAEEFDRACYQAVVHTQRRIERVHAIREIEGPPQIALHRLANYPIAQSLGLRIKHTQSGDSVVDWLEPVRPFWLRASVVEDLGRVVATVDPHLAPETAQEPPRHWVFAHPGAPARHPIRHPQAAQQPDYFAHEGATGIGAGLNQALREGDRLDLQGRVQDASRRMFVKELHAQRQALGALAAPASLPRDLVEALSRGEDFGAFLDAQPLERLRDFADAMTSALGAWRAPAARAARVRQLERLGELALGLEAVAPAKRGAVFARLADPAARARCERLAHIFVAPERETDAEMRGADARGLYETSVALQRALKAAAPPGETAPPAMEGAKASPRSPLLGLVKSVESWIVRPRDFEGDWTRLVPEAAEAAMRRLRLARFVAEYEFDAERMALLEATFGAWGPLRRLAQTAEREGFHEAQRRFDADAGAFDPTAALGQAADALAADVADWVSPERWLRMTRAEASAAVEQLDDLQGVFEAILDDGWGNGRGGAGSGPRVPAASLGPAAQDWAAQRGLRRVGGNYVVDAEAK